MQDYGARWLQILALMTTGVAVCDEAKADECPPSKETRATVEKNLNVLEGRFKQKTIEISDGEKLRQNLSKSIEALGKTYTPFAKEVEEMTTLAEGRVKQAAESHDDAAVKAAAKLQKQAVAMRAESEKMKTTLTSLKEIEQQTNNEHELTQKEVNSLKLAVQKTLLTYFKTADPSMIAKRYGVPLDINFSFDLPGYMKVTGGGDPKNWLARYGLVAEHEWDDKFAYKDKNGVHTITLKGIAQHNQVTTRDMADMANQLAQEKIGGVHLHAGRYALTLNYGHFKNETEAFMGVYAHPLDAFRPSVLSNSTGSWSPLNDMSVFRDLLDVHTKGEGTQTYHPANGTITYGLPPLGRSILSNSSGNSGYGFVPDMTSIQHFHPSHMNIGTVTIPLDPDTGKMDTKAPSEVEYYSTSNSSVHAVIKRPRYNQDGTETKVQYLNPDFEKTLEDNLWKLAGKTGTPSAEELTDEKNYPPALVAAVNYDKAIFLKVILRNEGTDAKGFATDLKGTSFAAPTAAGVLLAARSYYPSASEAEIMDAFCSACVPIVNRRTVDPLSGKPNDLVSDIPWIANPKTGYAYSPMVGFGEFVIDKNADRDKPETWGKSWTKMLARLEAMQKIRESLPNATVDIGNGADKRTVANNGQPPFVTLELDKAKEVFTEEGKKLAASLENEVMEAFKGVVKAYAVPDAKADPIYAKVKLHKYSEALGQMKKAVGIEKPAIPIGLENLLDLFRPKNVAHNATKKDDSKKEDSKKEGPKAGDPVAAAKEQALKQATEAVKKAEKMSQHTYAFNVLDNQDINCTMASVRLKFKDETRADAFVVLESPDGTKIPVIMSSALDWEDQPAGVAVASTPGVMRKSAAGTWKIHTLQELDPSGTELIISGTERNGKLVDVRSELTRIEMDEVKAGTRLIAKGERAIPQKNTLTIDDPHKHLRGLNGFDGSEKELKRLKVEDIAPSTRPKFQDYMEELIRESEVIKTLKEIAPDRFQKLENGHIERVSLNEPSTINTTIGYNFAGAVTQLASLLADSTKGVTADSVRGEVIPEAWGFLASALVNYDTVAQPDKQETAASRRHRNKIVPEGIGYLASLNSDNKNDVPPWWIENRRAQLEQARRSDRKIGKG